LKNFNWIFKHSILNFPPQNWYFFSNRVFISWKYGVKFSNLVYFDPLQPVFGNFLGVLICSSQLICFFFVFFLPIFFLFICIFSFPLFFDIFVYVGPQKMGNNIYPSLQYLRRKNLLCALRNKFVQTNIMFF
jgi:hypothetical protein